MFTTQIVTSQDGVKFSVQYETRNTKSAAIAKEVEEKWASRRLAADLEKLENYHRIQVRATGRLPELFAAYVALPALLLLPFAGSLWLSAFGN